MNEYNCPLCQTVLTPLQGDGINPVNGWYLYCANKSCPAQEVSGHGKTVKDAFEVIGEKFDHVKKA
jgi:hypothetical protein